MSRQFRMAAAHCLRHGGRSLRRPRLGRLRGERPLHLHVLLGLGRPPAAIVTGVPSGCTEEENR